MSSKPPLYDSRAMCEVLYKGPFRELTDDLGHTFVRGRWTPVDAATRSLAGVAPQ